MNIKKLVGEIAQQNQQYGKLANDLVMGGGLAPHAGITIDIEVKESSQGNRRLTPTDFRLVYNPDKWDSLPEDLQREFVQKALDQILRRCNSDSKLHWRVVQAELDELEDALNKLHDEGYNVDERSIYPIHKDAKTVWQIVGTLR